MLYGHLVYRQTPIGESSYVESLVQIGEWADSTSEATILEALQIYAMEAVRHDNLNFYGYGIFTEDGLGGKVVVRYYRVPTGSPLKAPIPSGVTASPTYRGRLNEDVTSWSPEVPAYVDTSIGMGSQEFPGHVGHYHCRIV